jgi:hypothetical protein
MFTFARLLQAAALALVAVGFVSRFPELMNPQLLLIAIGLFVAGWLLQRKVAH